MADAAPASKEPFNLSQLKELIELMEKHGVTSVSLRNGDEQWRLNRGAREVYVPMPSAPAPLMHAPQQFAAPATAPAAAAPAATAAAPATAAPTASNLPVIKSPTVGTFYASPSPEDPPFIQVGTKVQPDTVVCIIEAMKVFNEITADCSGTVAEVLIKAGDSVEFGQPLFRVRPS